MLTEPITVGSLCTGYGGLDMAAALTLGDLDHRWNAEVDPAASEVLAAHWPDTPNLGDITKVDFATVDPVRLLIAGYPCQGESLAGRRLGDEDERWLWPHVARAVRVVRPGLVLLENVPGHFTRGFGRVLADLASLGYVGSWECLPAADIGAPHRRERIFIAAWPAGSDPWWRPRLRLTPADTGRAARPVLPTPTAADGDRTSGTYARGNPTLTGALMPTPTAARYGSNQSPSPGAAVRPSLDSLAAGGALLPTPTKSDTTGPGRSTIHGMSLRTVASLLPTPAARLGDGRGAPTADLAADRYDSGRRNLDDAVALLPTPAARDHKGADARGPRIDGARRSDLQRSLPGIAAALLPTPRATDGTKGSPHQHGSSGDLMLTGAVMQNMLLPTPVAQDANGARNATCNRRTPNPGGDTGWTLGDVAHADRWGRYTDAITRWEHVTGRVAPDPTEPGQKGQPRLAPAFVEWMMGLPAGWVAGRVGRNAALRILGNGVVPAHGAYAYTRILSRT